VAAARAAAEAGENRVSARLGGPWASSRGQLGKRLKLAADPGEGSLLARFAAGDVGGVRGSSRPSAEVSLSVSASESTLGLGVVFGVVAVPWVAVAAVGVEVGRILRYRSPPSYSTKVRVPLWSVISVGGRDPAGIPLWLWVWMVMSMRPVVVFHVAIVAVASPAVCAV
jgi:hypothetical protein